MKLGSMFVLSVVVATVAAACGDDKPKCGQSDEKPLECDGSKGGSGGDGGSNTGGDGGTGGSGGSGGDNRGGTGGDGGGAGWDGTIEECGDLDRFFAEKSDAFALAAFAGATRFVEGQEVPLEVGFDEMANVHTYDQTQVPGGLGGNVTTLELWSEVAGGMIIRVPERGIMPVLPFDISDPDASLIRVRRTKDWITFGTTSMEYSLHVSTGTKPGGTLEVPGGGPVLSPSKPCRLAAAACTLLAAPYSAKLENEEGRVPGGSSLDMGETDKGASWVVRNFSGMREGACQEPMSARVLFVWDMPWRR